MKFAVVLLAFFLVCSLCIAGYIHSRRKQEMQLSKQASFQDIKFRVTRDVLEEYQDQLTQSNTLLKNTKTEVDTLTKDLSVAKTFVEKKKGDVDTCKGDKVRCLMFCFCALNYFYIHHIHLRPYIIASNPVPQMQVYIITRDYYNLSSIFLLQKRLTDEIAAAESETKHIQSEFPSLCLHLWQEDSLDIFKDHID